jgi:gluconate 2-dehydrogenase gamma chain
MKFVAERRRVLKAAIVPAVAVAPIAIVRDARADAPPPAAPRVYLTDAEFAFVEAAVARLIPNDALGPGAREAGVAEFIDHQLAGPYGRAETWYMQGPWRKGSDTQGYQLKLTPAALYRAAIADIDAHTHGANGGKAFAALGADAQDALLHQLEDGKVDLAHAPAKTFFKMLLQNTTEGFLADPMYRGNRDFIGWKLIGFPGPRYNYVVEIEQHGKRYGQPTVGLLGRDGRRVMKEA